MERLARPARNPRTPGRAAEDVRGDDFPEVL